MEEENRKEKEKKLLQLIGGMWQMNPQDKG
jgi:hypothetical protein